MKNFRVNLIIRLVVLSLFIFALFYVYYQTDLTPSLIILGAIIVYQIISLIRYVDITNKEITKLLFAIKYSDFSISFPERKLGKSFHELTLALNEVINKFRSTRKEKEENFRYLHTVMQHVGVGLISYSQSGKVEFINNAAKKLMGIQYLNNISSLNKISTGLANTFLEIRNGKKFTIKIAQENELIQLLAYSTEFKLRSQNYKLVALQNIQSELEEKEMDAWQDLIRVLTHEIMNSITPISSLASTVKDLLADGQITKTNICEDRIEDIRLAVNTIQKRSEGLIHFVEDYRSLTRIPKPNFNIFQIASMFERIETLTNSEMQENGIQLTTKIEPKSLELTADVELIEQAMINLINNARYWLKDIPGAKINLSANHDRRGRVVIRVTDNGSGIEEGNQDKIFIPFYTTKKNGSGVGLSLCRQIMRSHGGNIFAHSKPDKETTFSLRF